MAKVKGDKAPETPQDNKKTDKPAEVIDIKTGAVADSDKPAKKVKKPAKTKKGATPIIKGTPEEIAGAAKILKKARKDGKLKTDATPEEITEAIKSAGNDGNTFVPEPIHLEYGNAGKDPLGMKDLMVEMASYEKDLKQVKQRYNDDVADCKEVWAENRKPIEASIDSVHVRAAEKGVSLNAFNFLMKMNKPMTRAEHAKIQEERQLLLDVFGV